MTFPTLRGIADTNGRATGFMYWGKRGDWSWVLTQHRDSDSVERSNWYVITDDLMTRFPGDVAIESASSSMVGWVEHLLVRPGSLAEAAAMLWRGRLDDYPIADEQHWAMLEYDEEWCVRCDSGIRSDHPLKRCHKFRSENDAEEIRWNWRHRRDQ